MKLSFLSKSRGLRNLISRIITVACRFGISPKKFERYLQKYFEIAREAGCRPTLVITASVLARHPEYIRELNRQGVEFAVHGYVHIDYKEANNDKRARHFKEAMQVFNRCQVPFIGFRAPFLRTDGHVPTILSNLGFRYDSSQALWWQVEDINVHSKYIEDNLNRLLEFYAPLEADRYLSLPRFQNGLIEIPVSIPDDEALVERLGINSPEKIGDIWLDIVQMVYRGGELFNLSLHPERIEYCQTALKEVLRKAGGYSPPVWMATLQEIAEWWQERDEFSFDVEPQGDGGYRIRAACSERATILVKNGGLSLPAKPWLDGYQQVMSRDFILESTLLPVVGVEAGSAPAAADFLRSEGYIVDTDVQPGNCGLYLGKIEQFGQADEKALSQQIEQSDTTLVRYWRWPGGARSALSVTGDIDSITITDFVLRILENKFSR
jgi:hypothetical protein